MIKNGLSMTNCCVILRMAKKPKDFQNLLFVFEFLAQAYNDKYGILSQINTFLKKSLRFLKKS
ncbi:hypothetical protein DMC01_03595 [Campylobacter troglodytis]|nr:hypothetical protein DMC01_03595 [Campylobacter troglodytis]